MLNQSTYTVMQSILNQFINHNKLNNIFTIPMILPSKSVPKISSDAKQRLSLKLPSITPPSFPSKLDKDHEYQSLKIISEGNTKKLRASRNYTFMKGFNSEQEESTVLEKIKNPNVRRKSGLQSSVCQPSKSIKKEYMKSEIQDVYRVFNKLICADYNLCINGKQFSQSIKGVIEKGNNNILVRQVLKSRGYWNIKASVDEDSSSYTLIWTEFRKKQHTNPKSERELLTTNKNKQIGRNIKSNMLDFTNMFKLFVLPKDSRQEISISDMKESIKNINSKNDLISLDPKNFKLTNHLPQQQQLSNKKSLFQNLYTYYLANERNPFQNIPVTFHLTSSTSDPQFRKFLEYAEGNDVTKDLWIIKPGENTNRGNGISVEKGVDGVRQYLQSFKSKHTYLVQSYIKPYLYCQRKFDMRCYLLVVMINGSIRGYWYQQGYIRTSSEPFTYKKMDKMIHLTNDAVQKHGDNYGKFQAGNKISYNDLQKYIEKTSNKDFMKQIQPKMRNLALDALNATKSKIGGQRLQQGFEIFGLDFMLDQDLKPWLIEFNTNPCLETGALLLSRIIPDMLDNAFRIALDPFLIDSNRKISTGYQSFLRNNKFQLIYKD